MLECTDIENYATTVSNWGFGSNGIYIYGYRDGTYRDGYTWDGIINVGYGKFYSYNTIYHNGTVFWQDLFTTTPSDVTNTAYPLLPGSESGGGGTTGSYNDDSDAIDDDTFNTSMSAITGSAATIYATSSISDIDSFLNVLYGQTMYDRVTSIFNAIGSLGGKVTDYVMKFYMLPVSIGYTQTKYKFNTGWYDVIAPELMLPIATQRLKTVDMGSIKIDEYWGNALDYESNIEIYLPYVGYQKLDARAVMGKTINVVYQIDVMSADCVAQIFVDGDVLYQYNGNCGYELPISADCRLSDSIGKIASGVATVVAGVSLGG